MAPAGPPSPASWPFPASRITSRDATTDVQPLLEAGSIEFSRWSAVMVVVAGVMVGTAWWLVWPGPRFPGARRGFRTPPSPPSPVVRAADVADLAERLAGLGRAGVAEARSWQVLAVHGGTCREVAAMVSAVVSAGGTASEGLRVAAHGLAHPPDGPRARGRAPARCLPSLRRLPSPRRHPAGMPPGTVLGWLALASEVVERSGAPSGLVLDRITSAVRAEVAAGDEQQVATAGARSTAAVLATLPAAGVLLGALMGADVIGTLVGTAPGRACLVAGGALWFLGRRWTARLVRASSSPSRSSPPSGPTPTPAAASRER